MSELLGVTSVVDSVMDDLGLGRSYSVSSIGSCTWVDLCVSGCSSRTVLIDHEVGHDEFVGMVIEALSDGCSRRGCLLPCGTGG